MSRQEKQRRLPRALTTMLAILIVGVIIAVTLVVFQLQNVEVIGNSRYPAEQISSDLVYDFLTRNTLWLGWKYRSKTEEPRTPYLSSVQGKIINPGRLRLIVQEKTLSGYVQYNGCNVYFDSNGMVIEMTDNVYEDTVLITGVSMDEPVLYQKLPVSNSAQLRTMLSISRLMKESGLQPDSIEFDDNLNITANIGTVEVLLGQDEYLEEKVSNLETIYQMQAGQEGVLNMSAFTGKNETITFSDKKEPAESVVQEAAAQEGADGQEGQDAGTADAQNVEDSQAAAAEQVQEEQDDGEDEDAYEVVGVEGFMVFDSSGTLRYDARVIGGQVLDKYGNPIPGCSLNEDGNVVDAYWNVIDPMTGTLAQ